MTTLTRITFGIAAAAVVTIAAAKADGWVALFLGIGVVCAGAAIIIGEDV